MRSRKYVTPRDQLIAQGKELLQSSDDYKYAFKITLVLLITADPSEISRISNLTGVPIRTLSHWVRQADINGYASLIDKYSPGRTSSLSETQKANIYDVISNSADKYGFRSWNGANLAEYILKTYHVKLGVRQCQRLLHAWKKGGAGSSTM